MILRIAVDSISDTASNYESFGYFNNRTNISNEMNASLAVELKKSAFVDLLFFQLRFIDLPD